MVAEVATWQVVHDQVEILSILKRVVHIDDEGVLELRQNLPLVDDRLDTALRDDSGFAHFLHGEVLLGFLALDSPHLAKTAFADTEVIHKVGFRYRW